MSEARWPRRAEAGPVQVPVTRLVGVDPAVTAHSELSRSGAASIHADHERRTRAVRDAGKRNEKIVTVGAGTVLKVKLVTMPPLPPPPPRSAQKRSASWLPSTVCNAPSAVTTVAPVRWSQVRP